MFNYQNLNDVEFEELCKDIMGKKLGVPLRTFAKGRDGGIDLTDNVLIHNIVIQVKHYINSKFSDLKSSLEKEIEKVDKLKPKQYYVCCGKSLSNDNIKEIYGMFSNYMYSDKNIITLKEIDDFLQRPENTDIVRKHYKLWLYSSNILSEIYNQDIFVDCDALLSDIEEDCKYFVQTSAYEKCLECLKEKRIITMIGSPGVGKTMTSKMLVLFFANQGYKVRYTSNGSVKDIKKSLDSDKECKEIVLLDDCLGQHYFKMSDTQENELISLVKYIKLHPNKMLIMNSRVTIFNEAKSRSEEFKLFMHGNKIKIYTINMDQISFLEKAKMFYNHLIFKNVPREYYDAIRVEKNYLKIVRHRNYTPRIIEHITNHDYYCMISSNAYFQYICDCLTNPEDIWKSEFNTHLLPIDRIFLTTLYSLTDTNIDSEILKKCFENRLKSMPNIDCTVNNYEVVLERLNQSMVNIIDKYGKKLVGVINPSVNDFLKTVFWENKLELDKIRESILFFNQIQRCYDNQEQENVIIEMFRSEQILDICFESKYQKSYFITSRICKDKIQNEKFKKYINNYLVHVYGHSYFNEPLNMHRRYVGILFSKELYSYYKLEEIIYDEEYVKNILSDVEIDDLIYIINIIHKKYTENMEARDFPEWFIEICIAVIKKAIDVYCENIDVSFYCDSYDLEALMKDCYRDDPQNDMSYAVDTIEQWISDEVINELIEKIKDLPSDIRSEIDLGDANVSVSGSDIEGFLKSYFEPDPDDFEDYKLSGNGGNLTDIEVIFERN